LNTQNVALAVYIDGSTLTGTLSIPEGSRISDFLNDKTKTKTGFINLTDVTVKHSDGKRETSKAVYINKQSIRMITTLENDSARGIGAKDGRKQYPFVKKLPVRTTIQLPGYELCGYLHFTENDGVSLFAEDRTFIPCTDTLIYDMNKDSQWKIEFAALNKNHISCFEEKN
jgi:hypothetical protein